MTIRRKACSTLVSTLAALLLVAGSGATANTVERFCSTTASIQHQACRSEIKDDFYEAKAICANVSDDEERAECLGDASADHREGQQLCREQRAARLRNSTHWPGYRFDGRSDPIPCRDCDRQMRTPRPGRSAARTRAEGLR